jgi:hypothetical protein
MFGQIATFVLIVQYGSLFIDRHDAGIRTVLISDPTGLQVGHVNSVLAAAFQKAFPRGSVTLKSNFVGVPELLDLVGCFVGALIVQPVQHVWGVDHIGSYSQRPGKILRLTQKGQPIDCPKMPAYLLGGGQWDNIERRSPPVLVLDALVVPVVRRNYLEIPGALAGKYEQQLIRPVDRHPVTEMAVCPERWRLVISVIVLFDTTVNQYPVNHA